MLRISLKISIAVQCFRVNAIIYHQSARVCVRKRMKLKFITPQIELIHLYFVCSIARKRPHEGYNTSSDSEEELLRRLQMQQSSSLHSGQLSKYGAGPLNENLSSLKHITVATHRERFNDPLGVAERGKVGLPPSSSECSSNSSADASVESNMGILHGERKGTFQLWYLILTLCQIEISNYFCMRKR